ncbi:MFS transporter [Streptomyces sp. TLI_171]|uniref:MFS transporter n=1 Tax=Streptomyces sp. TLI_171 TaxID=1938859 RepID=UPI000C5628A4|nr:MFS transporter [Streptomyces sp. TLI_171]RKE19815.1 putative MFS family arabinose efflux permease [Streptomyces sp. TLI_171]
MSDPGERRYRLLVAGYAVSSYGTFLNLVALNLYVYAVTGRALAVGAFMAARLAAGFAAGLAAGALLARRSARSVMLTANLAQAAALLLLAAAPAGARTAMLFLVAATVGAGGTLFLVALRSSTPALVGEDRATWANSLMVSGRSGAMVAGFASSGLVVSLLGYTAALLADAVTFAVCAATVAALPAARPRPERAADPQPRTRLPAAVAALGTVPALGLMVALRGVDALGSSSHNAALPVYSTRLDPHHPAVFVSVFWCVWALGNVLVQQVLRRRHARGGRPVGARGFGLGTIAMSAAFVLAFAGLPWAATVPIAVLAGAADGLTEVAYTSHLQTLPEALRGHAFGLSATVENLGFGAGMLAVAAALDTFAPLPVVAVAHGTAIALALVFLARLTRRRSTLRAAAPDAARPPFVGGPI